MHKYHPPFIKYPIIAHGYEMSGGVIALRTLCNTKVRIGKHGTSASTYNDMRKQFPSTNNMEYGFGFIVVSLSILWVAKKNEYILACL